MSSSGEDFWRWQTMNPQGYRTENASSPIKKVAALNGTSNGVANGVTNGNH